MKEKGTTWSLRRRIPGLPIVPDVCDAPEMFSIRDDGWPCGSLRNDGVYSNGHSLERHYSDGCLASSPKTGLAYDPLMCKHECTCRDRSKHLEHPGRIQSIWSRLQETGLASRCRRITARKASLEYIRLVHADAYVNSFCNSFRNERSSSSVFSSSTSGASMLSSSSSSTMESAHRLVKLFCGGMGVDLDTYFAGSSTISTARLAVGCVVDLCVGVVTRCLRNGFAVVRPPGHHAEADQALGFCFFNNIAVAAAVMQRRYGLKRILILDWDVHHGNGTQLAFESDPHVLYVSFHRHDQGTFIRAQVRCWMLVAGAERVLR